jgi:hypothetical protein
MHRASARHPLYVPVASAGTTLRSRIGGSRVLDMLTGEQLPRIC